MMSMFFPAFFVCVFDVLSAIEKGEDVLGEKNVRYEVYSKGTLVYTKASDVPETLLLFRLYPPEGAV